MHLCIWNSCSWTHMNVNLLYCCTAYIILPERHASYVKMTKVSWHEQGPKTHVGRGYFLLDGDNRILKHPKWYLVQNLQTDPPSLSNTPAVIQRIAMAHHPTNSADGSLKYPSKSASRLPEARATLAAWWCRWWFRWSDGSVFSKKSLLTST